MSPVTFSQLDPNIEEVLKLVRHHAHQLHRLINEACESNTNEKETLWENAKTQAEQLAKYENEIENWLELNRQFKRRVKKHEILAFTEIQGYLLYTARIVSGEDQGASSSGPGFQGLMDEEETSDSETLDQGTSSSGAGAGFQGIMDQDTSSSGPGFQGLMDEEETSDSETLNDQDQVAVMEDETLVNIVAAMLILCPPFDFSGKYYDVVSGDGCGRQSSFFEGKAVLNQSVGYSVILGFGAFFAVFTSFLVWLEKRYVGSKHTSEWFNTAGRNVKTGLIASVIVSQWTWAATILQSSNVAWQYGVSGPFWYASGATIQVLLFGVMAIEIKRKAPHAHTVCEIVKARWGTAAHMVFLSFCFLTNIIVTAMLLLGGSAVVNALTGVNIYAASFLIPLGVIVYTLAGGLKATFLASYIHSVIVHVVLVIFVYLVYTASNELGSPRVVYNRLIEVASKSRICQEPISHQGQSCGPVSGNYKGSYLTMMSSGGLVFGIINIVGNFGTVFVDNGYWVSAIAARPSSTHKGYLLGGLVWFAVPFSLATSLGLGALALDLPITASEAGRGLVPPATAIALMGKGGSVLLLTMLFMAVTSAGSSELIAVSSLCTYDIYRTYIDPDATGKTILKVSRAVILGFGCFMGLLAVMLNKAGVSLGWMYLAMGVFIGSAVLPIAFMLLWRKANAIGAILGASIGCLLGIITWLSVAKIEYGRVNLDTTGRNAPMLAGNLVSILAGGAIHAICSFMSPQNYDWGTTRQITVVEKEKSELPAEEYREEKLLRAKAWIVKWGVGFTFVIVLLWPLLSLPAGAFSIGYFTFWAVIAIAWGTIGSIFIITLPLYESWETIQSVLLGMFTNDRLMEKVEEMNLRLRTVMLAIPEAERIYLLEKEKAKKKEPLEQVQQGSIIELLIHVHICQSCI